ncbi:receptor-like protein 9DC3 [Camellia sinensis]|uniref:receptor-like protein 9DC3 n=1 Tax=Camellia sinensis TaxID=4442 RepID=UPI001036BA3B|nr:receptor-like protein 9DC3 [Camellia sinensis]
MAIGVVEKQEHLNLAFNHFNYFHIPSAFGVNFDLTGNLPKVNWSSSSSLKMLNLVSSSFSGELPDSIGYLKPLNSLNLTSCQILQLTLLDLSENNLDGKIPNFSGLHNLQTLHLHNNSLNGTLPSCDVVELRTFTNLKNLDYLDLSYNSLSVSTINNINNTLPKLRSFYMTFCKIKEFPDFFKALENVEQLDVSNNEIHEKIPKWNLEILDLRSNLIQGQLPVPPLSGNIPMMFGMGNQLEILNLNGNQFEGPVTRSLTNCRQLQVLDLGNNKINDTFPYWLRSLPELRVLVLRSNKFHGPIDNSKPNLSFPKFRIVDLSHNKFTGHLSGRYFKHFKAMRNKTMPNEKYLSFGSYYQASIAVTMKGSYISLTGIFTLFITIDLSSNKFNGDIPNVIRRLNSLIVLNLSHNSLTGFIPFSLGDLTEFESLDLSSNQLIGKIPNQLKSLTFLEVFNLSCNHLDGPIPQGEQFDTFVNDS